MAELGWTALSIGGGGCEDWPIGVVEDLLKVKVPLTDLPSRRDLRRDC